MFGADWEANNPAPQVYYGSPTKGISMPAQHTLDSSEKFGIIPNTVSHLFSLADTDPVTIYCSFLQLYNEKLYDLLNDATREKPLNIREDPIQGIFVENLAEFVVESASDCFFLLRKGDRNRAVRQTKFNFHSSRSHTLFQLLVESDRANQNGLLTRAKLNLCDLAGSEKYDKDGQMVRDHVQEMTSINKSLCTLGQVIRVLGSKEKGHIPYRNSKLTRLLQDSLAVNTRTILIATVSPSLRFIEETINTLKFADSAKQVMVRVKKNQVSATNDLLVNKLQKEIQYLKSLLKMNRAGGMSKIHQEMMSLREENHRLKEITRKLTIGDVEKLKQDNKRLRLQLQQRNPAISGETGSTVDSGVCVHCGNFPPCPHTASVKFPPISNSLTRYPKTVEHKSVEPNRVSYRVRQRNTVSEEAVLVADNSDQRRKKKIRDAEKRLMKLAKLEAFREEKLRKELEVMEEKRRKEEDEVRQQELKEKKRKKYLQRQKKKLQHYQEARENKILELREQFEAAQSKPRIQKPKRKLMPYKDIEKALYDELGIDPNELLID